MEFMSYIMITIYTMDIIFVAVSVTLNDAGVNFDLYWRFEHL